MGFFSKFEGKVDDAFEGMSSAVFKSPIEPTQIAKRCEKEMNRNKLVGKGVQYAPTLYTVLVNENDDKRLFGFYPTMAGEIETFLVGAAGDADLTLECRPLVRFIADEGLKSGKFDVIAEVVTSNIIAELREEEAEYYGLDNFAKGSREPIPSRNPNPRPGGTSKRAQQNQAKAADGYGQQYDNYGSQYDFSGIDNLDDVDNIELANPNAGVAAASAKAGIASSERVGGAHARPSNANAASNNRTVLAGAQAGVDGNLKADYGYQGVLENARTGEITTLDYKNMLVGREAHCDICIADSSVSRNHARLIMDDMGTWTIEDLGSTNGTKVNGHAVQRAELRFGDQITFGTTVMIFKKG